MILRTVGVGPQAARLARLPYFSVLEPQGFRISRVIRGGRRIDNEE